MSAHVTRRRLRARRNGRRGGMPIWLTLLLVLGLLGSLAAAAGFGALFFVYESYAQDYVPIEEKLRQENVGLTQIYDRGGPDGGVLLGALTNPDAQLLDPVALDKISPWMIQATISTEDNTFETNPGVNFQGLARAAYENYVGGGIGSGTGGSSITQQLIKNVYICPSIGDEKTRCASAERTLDRKLREIAYALELEKDYPKDKILEWYLNQISYADRYVGIQAAAEGYFHKNAADLTLAEAALLAGVPQAPTAYHPRLNCLKGADETCVAENGQTVVAGEAKRRQEDVLDLMVKHGRATREQADAAKAEVVKVYASSNPIKAGAFIDNQVEPRLVRMCLAGQLEKIKGATDCLTSVHAAGYKVTTTIDWPETAAAEEMIRGFILTGLSNGCECYNAAIATIEPSSGQVIIYAPNRDPSYVSDPRVAGNIDQLTEINQPGSSFKPAVYLTWFDSAVKSPMNIIWDTSPLEVEGTSIVDPRRDNLNEGLITARAGLGGSQNVPAFRAATEAGVDNVIETAKKLGITTLDQHFDPTFRDHKAVTYGASIATGGANIRVIDMAYMNATIANMGVMVGVETLAKTVELKDLKGTATHVGAEYDEARRQALDFARGNIRIPGTRELDPIVILQIMDKDGKVVFTQPDPKKKQVFEPGSVWLLHSIMSDCNARFLIWSCGGSNNDLALDFFTLDGKRIPGGVKTGTQQGPRNAVDTLATWMNGYSRYAATSVWVGNATKELVKDGPAANYAAANTTVRLFKNWMGTYHSYLQSQGKFTTPEGFNSLRPRNVAERELQSPTTERRGSTALPGGCDQMVTGWVRTDVKYEAECEEKEVDSRNGLLASEQTPAQFRVMRKFVKLPVFKPEPAVEMAKEKGIPVAPTEKSTGEVAVSITSPTNGKTITALTQVIGAVQVAQLKEWKLELGLGSNPTEWKTIGQGTNNVTNAVLGTFDVKDLQNSVYTIRLTADGAVKNLVTLVVINVRKTPGVPGSTQTPFGGLLPQVPPLSTPSAGGGLPLFGPPPETPTPGQ